MDLNTITAVIRPQARTDLPTWTQGDAWLAGGTWLYSEPQIHLTRLVDLTDLKWPALTVGETHLSIAATCTIAQLEAMPCPPDWIASPLIAQCARSFLASFKIWKTATVGGNLCLALPAAPMVALTAALDGDCLLWSANGERRMSVTDFIIGNMRNALAPGELLRQIDIPLTAVKRRVAFRQISLTPVGRSAALLIGTADANGEVDLTVTASTIRPVKISFKGPPSVNELSAAIKTNIPDALYHDDVHGKPDWRKAMTFRLADEIRAELHGEGS